MVLKLENVSRNFGTFFIKNINIDVKKGEYFVLLGPTGAGKTLLLELIAGFYIAEQGTIFFGGIDATYLSPEKRNIGFVSQDYSLFSHMTVEKNVSFGLDIRKISQGEIDNKVKEIMDIMSISNLYGRYPHTLSGGEQQRVALARALVIDPEILLLDEPLNALDPGNQEKFREELKNIHQTRGITTIHVTHDQREALLLADRIGIMMDGQIIQIDSPDGILDEPVNLEVANFVGMHSIFSGKIISSEDGLVLVKTEDFDLWSVTKYSSGDVKVLIRSENVILSKVPIESSARNNIKCKIVKITPLGSTVRIELDKGLRSLITKNSLKEFGFNIGDEIYATFKATEVYINKR